MAMKGVGYDPGSAFRKAAVVERHGDRWRLVEAAVEPASAPAAFWRKGRFPRDPVTALVGAERVTLRELRHPLKDPQEIAQTIRYEAEPYLSIPLEEAVIQHRQLSVHEKGSRVLLLALPKARLAEFLSGLKEEGVDPVGVSCDAAALWNAFATLGPAEAGPATLLDLGASKTVLAHFEGGELRLLRTLRGRGESVPLAQEVRRSWAAEGVDPAAARVLLTGGGSVVPGFAESLAGELGCPVAPFDFLSRMDHGLKGEAAAAFGASGAAAVGAALASAGSDSTGVDFRREEFRYRGRFARLAGPLTSAAFAGAALLGVLGMEFHRRGAGWREHRGLLEGRMGEVRAAALGAESPTQQALLAEAGASALPTDAALLQLKTFLERRQDAARGDNALVSALDLLRGLFQALPEATEMTVTDLQVAQPGVTLKGRMTDETSVWALSDAVNRAAGGMLEASPPNAVSRDGSYEFTLTARRKP